MRRHGNACGCERRQERAVERETLHRVVLVSDHVEEPSEPAGRLLRIERTDLPEVPRREVRLVWMAVADGREDGELSLGVEAGEWSQGRVPVEPAIALERGPVAGFQGQLRA